MMRSLYSGVAGLKSHQTKMDVIGNNIANVNTTAYKSQSITFSELMYQTTQSASGANAATGVGGTNARQIGLGVKTGAINTAITSQGSTQTTNNPFDIMITGEAFFVVNNGSDNYFTRDGSFYIDGAGNLAMTSTGYNVMGWQLDETTGTIKQDTVSALKIMSTTNMTYPPEATTKATVSGIIDKNDTNVTSDSGRIMNLEFYDNQGYKYVAKMSVHAINGDTGEFYVKLDDIQDANGESIGATSMAQVAFGGYGATGFTYNPSGLVADATGKAPGEAGYVETYADPTATETITNAIKLNYVNGTGKFQDIVESATETDTTGKTMIDFGTLANFQDIEVDFSDTSNYNYNASSTIGAVRGDANELGAGRKIGELNGINIAKDGVITANYDNGQSRTLGQIAVATFANASGLSKEGDNLYAATTNSGEFNGIGEDISLSGYMTTGVLEMSNVDLSSEFTEMITTQRGFQANSRIITVSDTLLEELTNLKR